MRVISADENTGRMEIELDENERTLLLEYAINNILRNYLDNMEWKGQDE